MKYYLSLFLLNINIIFTYIKIPFKTYKSDDINSFFNNYLYIELDIGLSKQNNSKILFKKGKYSFYLYDNNFFSKVSYNNKASISYRKLSEEILELTTSTCSKGILSTETFFIQNQRIDNFTFILCTKSKNEEYELFDGEIGLNLGFESPPNSNFIEVLKSKEIIKNYIYSINYINDNEGFLLIGEYPHKIKSSNNFYEKYSDFEENNLYWVKSIINNKVFHWTILFDKISYGDGGIYQAQREARLLI